MREEGLFFDGRSGGGRKEKPRRNNNAKLCVECEFVPMNVSRLSACQTLRYYFDISLTFCRTLWRTPLIGNAAPSRKWNRTKCSIRSVWRRGKYLYSHFAVVNVCVFVLILNYWKTRLGEVSCKMLSSNVRLGFIVRSGLTNLLDIVEIERENGPFVALGLRHDYKMCALVTGFCLWMQ